MDDEPIGIPVELRSLTSDAGVTLMESFGLEGNDAMPDDNRPRWHEHHRWNELDRSRSFGESAGLW